MQGSARLAGQTIGALVTGLLLAGTSATLAPRLGLALGAVFAIAAALVSAAEARPRWRLRRHARAGSRDNMPKGEIA
jgi:DHA2 family multidrug resistance protein-like MFS transporter